MDEESPQWAWAGRQAGHTGAWVLNFNRSQDQPVFPQGHPGNCPQVAS